VVNPVDSVTMLPPSGVTIELSSLAFGFIPYAVTKIKEILLSTFGGYYHCGNMRYLSICKTYDYDDVKLLYSVSFIFRARAFCKNNMLVSKIPADNSITVIEIN
jgi:triacylglycerol lipase